MDKATNDVLMKEPTKTITPFFHQHTQPVVQFVGAGVQQRRCHESKAKPIKSQDTAASHNLFPHNFISHTYAQQIGWKTDQDGGDDDHGDDEILPEAGASDFDCIQECFVVASSCIALTLSQGNAGFNYCHMPRQWIDLTLRPQLNVNEFLCNDNEIYSCVYCAVGRFVFHSCFFALLRV